ncbi:unnamed protein product [Auanema sp. JU1783]|nr:unnamed protein product [Auanema sp. JU1783]
MPGFPVIVGHNVGKPPGNQAGAHGSIHKLGHVRSVNLEVEISIDAVNSGESVGGITKIQLKDVPIFLINAFKIISQSSSLNMEGLFRKEGNATRINRNNFALYVGEIDFASHPERFTVHDICSMVKRFFRDLKMPLIYGLPLKKKLFNLVQKSNTEDVTRIDITSLFDAKRDENGKLVAPLEQAHLGTLGFLMRQLHYHQMTAENLATIFAPSLFRDEAPRKKPKDGRRGSHEDLLNSARSETDLRISAVRILIERANWIGLPTNFYLTSGKQRSASLAPTSPRYPLVHDMVNVTKDNMKITSKRQSMKLPRSKEDNGNSVKANERRSSSTLRELFSFNRLRRRSNSRERVPDRRRTVEVKSTIYPPLPQPKQHSKPPSPAQKFTLEIEDDNTPIVKPSSQNNTSSSRLSRSQQQRRGRQPTPGPADKTNDLDTTPIRGSRMKKTGSIQSTSSSDVIGEAKMKSTVSRDHPDSMFGEDAFNADLRKERQMHRRRRHTTPVKTNALRRNQPNSHHSGLRLPKRRVTLTAREDHEKENDPKRRSLSADRSYTQSIEDNDYCNDTLNSTTDILEQRGYESRLRRQKMTRRKELASSGKLVDAATSPMVVIANENTATPLRKAGSATVGEKVVVSTHNDVTPQQILEQLYSPHSVDISSDLSTRRASKTPTCSPAQSNSCISPTVSFVVRSPKRGQIGSPDPPPLPGAPPPPNTIGFRPPLVAQHSLDAQMSRVPAQILKAPLQKMISADRKEKPIIMPKPASLTKNSPLQRRGMSLSCIGHTGSPLHSVGDDDFADSDAIRQKILSSTTGDWNLGSRKALDQRPSVAFIRNNNCGMVRERVNLFSQMNVMETISGRSSAMSNRTSLGGNSTMSDHDDIKPSAPPVGHVISMGRRSTSSVLSNAFISPSASPRPT